MVSSIDYIECPRPHVLMFSENIPDSLFALGWISESFL